MKGRLGKLLFVAIGLGATFTASAELDVRLRAGTAYVQTVVHDENGFGDDTSLFMYTLTAAANYGRWFGEIYYQAGERSIGGDDKGTFVYSAETFEKSEYGAVIGRGLGAGLALFGGVKHTASVWKFNYAMTAINEYSVEANGFVLGLGYSTQFDDTSNVSVTIGQSIMDATQKLDQKSDSGYSAINFGFGVAYTKSFTEHFGMRVDFKSQGYRFDFSGTSSNTQAYAESSQYVGVAVLAEF